MQMSSTQLFSHVVQRCTEEDFLNQYILMQQAFVVAQVLAHNAVHAAFAGFTGVTVCARGSALPLDTVKHCDLDCCVLLAIRYM